MVSMGAWLPSRPLSAALDSWGWRHLRPLPTDAMNAHDASPVNPMPDPPGHAAPGGTGRRGGRDPLLLGAAALVGLLLAYQLAVTLLLPAWAAASTDWLLTLLAWPELA